MRTAKKTSLAWPLLALLFLADAVFIGLHVWLSSMGWFKMVHQLHLEWGAGPKYYNYLKWLICSLALLWLFVRHREPLYLAWATLFLYLLIEEAVNIRNLAGARIADVMDWEPAWGLRGNELGELAIPGIVGAILLGALGFAYWCSDDKEAKALSRALVAWLAVLVVFGVGVDKLHALVSDETGLSALFLVLEEGGEMIVASILTALVCSYAFPVIRGATLTAR